MKATKYTVTITVEVLSLDSVPALINRAKEEIDAEACEGQLRMEDGDTITWSVDQHAFEV